MLLALVLKRLDMKINKRYEIIHDVVLKEISLLQSTDSEKKELETELCALPKGFLNIPKYASKLKSLLQKIESKGGDMNRICVGLEEQGVK